MLALDFKENELNLRKFVASFSYLICIFLVKMTTLVYCLYAHFYVLIPTSVIATKNNKLGEIFETFKIKVKIDWYFKILKLSHFYFFVIS